MKQVFLFFILSVYGTALLVAQDSNPETQTSTAITTKSTRTSDKNWRWENNQWYYKDKTTDMFPAFYTKTEETVTTITDINGVIKKYCYRIEIEVHTQYETETPGWRWNGVKWEYQKEETESFPPQYTMKKTEKKTESDSCEE